jgi:hypothetical protein
MRRVTLFVAGLALAVGARTAYAHSEHEHAVGAAEPQASHEAVQEQTLTGEVVDVFCYLSHGKDGLGKGHASCAKKCIKSGLPVAIRVGEQLYLATMADHNPANERLAELAGQQVTVRGKVMELEGQRLIAVSQVQSAQ